MSLSSAQWRNRVALETVLAGAQPRPGVEDCAEALIYL
jgi:hypothetical protein